jgi:transmembrane sensor
MTDEPWPEGIEPTPSTIEASAWLSRLLNDPTDVDLAECKQWFDATEDHRTAFASVMFATPMPDEIRQRIGTVLGESFAALHTSGAPEVVAKSRAPAAAAQLPWGPRRPSAGKSGKPSRSRRRQFIWVGVAAAAVAVIALTVELAPNVLPGVIFSPAKAETLETGHGMIRSFALSDGSKVTLDSDSRVEVTMDRIQRHALVRQGRARFVLKHDPRPFSILVGAGEVVATNGTIDVTIGDELRVELRLRSGSAVLHKAGEPKDASDTRMLTADQPITYPASDFTPQAITNPVTDTRDWPEGWVEYRTISLANLINEANRYEDKPILLDDGSLATLAVTGRFKLTDTDTFVSRIAELFNLSVSRRSDGIHLNRK